MKKIFLTLLLGIIAGAVFAQENSIFPKEGKIMEYTTAIKSQMGDQKIDIKQYIKSKDGDKVVITTEAAGQIVDLAYKVSGDNIIIPLKEMMSASLGQLGDFEVVETTGDFVYPVAFEVGKEYASASMKIKAKMQGMEIALDISMEDRQAVAKESITVPAGTFDCIKLVEKSVMNIMGQDQISEMTSWYAQGVGLVKQYTNGMNGMMTNTMELVKISDK